jgi:hypothetical protein
MKKLLSILCVSIIALTAASCKKETIVTPGALPIFAKANNWASTDGGKTYSADVSVPEIDDYYDRNGAVLVYNDLGNGEYEALPSVYGGITYRFTYTGGHVYLDAQNSDGNSVTPLPPTLNLKIVLVD